MATRPWWYSSFVALAAGLILFVLAGGWLWTWQRHRSQQADGQAQVTAARQSLDTLRAENQRLRTEQKQTQEKIVQLAARVEALTAPKLNAPVALIYSMGATRRPGEQTVFSPVAVPQGAPFITLVLYKASKTEYPSYGVELRDPRNAVVWRAAGLTLNATLDAYTLNLPTELVLPTTGAPPRDYRLVVYGEDPGRRIPMDHYGLRFIPKP